MNSISKVAVLGPEPTYSSEAAREMIAGCELQATFHTIREVVKAVSERQYVKGIVPIRNSIAGEISDTVQALKEFSNVKIDFTKVIAINLFLIGGESSSLNLIQKVASKAQALKQCSKWLRMNLPNAKQLIMASTSEPVELVKSDPEAALVGIEKLAEIFELKILARNIEDDPDNATEFACLTL